jgi:tryptophanyl-tRNA synthetase
LFSYPVLMAADILLYIEQEEVDLVIVGQDQQQHCELVATVARKFNNFYQKKLLKLPQFNIPQLGSKIMGLRNPEKKMSKSESDYISLLDEPEVIKKKVKRAKMDSDPENKIHYDPKKKPGVSNLLTIYALLKKITPFEAEEEVNGLNYDQFKTRLSELICAKFSIIQGQFPLYQGKIDKLLEKSRLYCQDFAQQKLRKIKAMMKLEENIFKCPSGGKNS